MIMNMKSIQYTIIPLFLVFIDVIVFSIADHAQRIEGIQILSWTLWIGMLTFAIIDLINNKRNQPVFPYINLCLIGNLFAILVSCFVNDYFEFTYVWNNSSSSLPVMYKIIAIWAGDSGSFMLWMLLNAAIIFLYRLKIKRFPDESARVSIMTCTVITIAFLVIYTIMDPFEIHWGFVPGGGGLNPSLQSPFMAWHPVFVFLAYSLFLIPFSVTIAWIIKPRCTIIDPYQDKFFTLSLKSGWLIFTLGIASGAIWAKVSMGWGGYWDWDPVETVSLVPWFLCAAYFHAASFPKEKKGIILANLLLIFTTILFLSLLVRGGGFTSLHAYASMANLIIIEDVVGLFSILMIFLLIYKMIDKLYEESKNKQKIAENVAYLCLLLLAFITMIGLIVPPLGLLFSPPSSITSLSVNPGYFQTSEIIPAMVLAIAMIFCSSIQRHKVKAITITIITIFAAMAVVTTIGGILSGTWINPLVSIFILAAAASLLQMMNGWKQSPAIRTFFKMNDHHLIHAGIAFILTGAVLPEGMFQDIMYYTGFIIVICGISLSLLFTGAKSAAPAILE